MSYTRAFLSKKFDFLYRAALATSLKYDPCRIRDRSCYSMREFPELHEKDPFCCKGCKYLDRSGCTVKSLACKVWVCSRVIYREMPADGELHDPSPVLRRLALIEKVGERYGLMVFRGSKEDSLQQALARFEEPPPLPGKARGKKAQRRAARMVNLS